MILFRMCLYLISLILICFQLYWISFIVLQKNFQRFHFLSACLSLLISTTFVVSLQRSQDLAFMQGISDGNILAAIINCLFVALMYGITFYLLNIDVKKKQNEITEDSIREGINAMSAGLCFYDENGLPILMNDEMEMISQLLFKRSLLNGKEFWDELKEEKMNYGKRIHATYPTYLLSNGKVFSFHQQLIFIGNEKIFQLLASDVTTLFEISQQIDVDNKKLAKINLRLQEYNQNVSTLTREEEILSAKIRVHDDLGHSILATKYYLRDLNSTIDKEQLLKMWKTNISLLKKEEVQKKNDEALSYLYDAANAIGLKLVVNGSVSTWNVSSKRLLSIAVRENMTNAIQHSHASTLYISIQNKFDRYRICFENDGEIPSSIVEGGGLSSLRKQVEKMSGTMKISCDPKFLMEIEIPRKDDANV